MYHILHFKTISYFIPDAEFENSIQKYNLVLSNVPPPILLICSWEGVLGENYKYLQLQEHTLR